MGVSSRDFSLSSADFAICIMDRKRGFNSLVSRTPTEMYRVELGLSRSKKMKWIDAGGNPAVRHEGVPPSNNLIKDGTHRATVFVGPTLKSFHLLFFVFSPKHQTPLWR